MRKVILNLALSLDSYIEGPNGEFDWCFADQDYGMKQFLERTDAVFFGRKSYELLMSMEENPYPDKMKYVFSRTLESASENVAIIHGDLEKEVWAIKNKPGKDIWLYGGAELLSYFINYRLVDELQLSVHPLLLGKGKPLFSGIKERFEWELLDVKTFSTGLVQLFYRKK